MFISVVLPAPFSPRSAIISPRRRSKLTASLASRDPNLLVMPRSRRTSSGSALTGAGVTSARFRFFVVDLDNKGPALDLFLARLDFGFHIGWNLILKRAERRQAAAAMLHERIDTIVFSLEGAGLDLGDGLVEGRLEVPQR